MIRIETDTPVKLLKAIKLAIDNKGIQTWGYDEEGDFTHTAPQWNKMAWLRPTTEPCALVLSIVAPLKTHISEEVYAIYHGRFVEMILAHFDRQFSNAATTAMPASSDIVAA